MLNTAQNQLSSVSHSPAKSLLNAITNRVLAFTGSQRYLTIQLDITNACNLRCIHCYHPDHKNDGALSYEDWQRIMDQYSTLLAKLHLKPAVTICGGEPMTSPYLKPLFENSNARWPGVDITILTNGTVVRADMLELFKKSRVHFQVSVDGPDSIRHDEIRGAGNFAKTLRGIEWFRSASLDVYLQGVLSKKTSTWIPEFFDWAKNLGVESMNFTRFIPEGYGSGLLNAGSDRPLSPAELRAAMESILLHSRRTGVKTNTDQPLYAALDPSLGRHGMFGFQGLIVDYKGNLKVSSRSGFILGNIFEKGMENLFLNHPLMRSLRNGEINGCGGCEFYRRCGGNRTAAYAASGSFLAADPACWLLEEKTQRRVN